MSKKFFISLATAAVMMLPASAQNLFNHLGADLSVSTTGIGIELSTPVTDYLQLRAGLSIMPNINFSADVDGTLEVNTPLGIKTEKYDMSVDAGFKRTQGDVILNVYPFGRHNSLFIAAGAYFGGETLITLEGHSDKVASYQHDGILKEGWMEVGNYKVNFEKNGNINGALAANKFRPYLGLGYGRPCPKKRIGFMVELGVQFMGNMKVYQGTDLEPINLSDLSNDDDWQKWMDKLTVYPVLKFTLSGRIF